MPLSSASRSPRRCQAGKSLDHIQRGFCTKPARLHRLLVEGGRARAAAVSSCPRFRWARHRELRASRPHALERITDDLFILARRRRVEQQVRLVEGRARLVQIAHLRQVFEQPESSHSRKVSTGAQNSLSAARRPVRNGKVGPHQSVRSSAGSPEGYALLFQPQRALIARSRPTGAVARRSPVAPRWRRRSAGRRPEQPAVVVSEHIEHARLVSLVRACARAGGADFGHRGTAPVPVLAVHRDG